MLIGYLIVGEMNILRKRAQKVTKHNHFTFYDSLAQCFS